jgi:hypothetical protein
MPKFYRNQSILSSIFGSPDHVPRYIATQNSGLQQALGAFKATPIRRLETEAYVPPLDLWCRMGDYIETDYVSLPNLY